MPSFTEQQALDLGGAVVARARARGLPITVEVHRGDRVAFRAALPGSEQAQDGWIERKARVVRHEGHSTMYERVRYEARGTTFEQATGLPETDYAAHGGGFPIAVVGEGLVGVLLISGLPQVQDHALAVECLEEFAAARSVTPLGWGEVSARLGAAKVWWMATGSPTSGPHSVPVWGVVVDGVAYTTAEPTSRRARDLQEDPRTVVHLESGSDVLIVHGHWTADVDWGVETAVLAAYAGKYDSPDEAPYLPDAPGMAAVQWWSLVPSRALAWLLDDFDGTQRRWSPSS
jgi:uncharacterized protein (UPF0303 family)